MMVGNKAEGSARRRRRDRKVRGGKKGAVG